MHGRPIRARRYILSVALVCTSLVASRAGAEVVLRGYSAFRDLDESRLATVQFKLSQLFGSFRTHVSAGGAVAGHRFDVDAFRPYYNDSLRYHYTGDVNGLIAFEMTAAEIGALIDSIGALPSIAAGGVDPTGFMSVSMLQTSADTVRIFEAIVNTTDGRRLFQALLRVFAGNGSATSELHAFACVTDLLDPRPPTKVTGEVAVELRGVHRVRRTEVFVGTVRVTNRSRRVLGEPLLVVLRPAGGGVVDIVDPDGFTCVIRPAGAAVLALKVGRGLRPGACVERVVRFENDDLVPIEPDVLDVYQGTGTW